MPRRPDVASRRARASSPLETLRTARMMREASRSRKCRAASKPRPTFEPVMRTVLPEKEVVGKAGGDHLEWSMDKMGNLRTALRTAAMAELEEGYC